MGRSTAVVPRRTLPAMIAPSVVGVIVDQTTPVASVTWTSLDHSCVPAAVKLPARSPLSRSPATSRWPVPVRATAWLPEDCVSVSCRVGLPVPSSAAIHGLAASSTTTSCVTDRQDRPGDVVMEDVERP